MIHLSELYKGETCAALLWRSRYEPQPFFAFLHPSLPMREWCARYFGLTRYFEGKAQDEPRRAMQALQEYDALFDARFEAAGIRFQAPLLLREKEGFALYFLYRSCYPRESEAQRIADTVQLLKMLAVTICAVRVVYLRADYVRGDTLEVKELLGISDALFDRKNHQKHTILELCEPLWRDAATLAQKAKECERLLQQPVCPKSIRSPLCTRNRKCAYYNACFSEPLPDDSILYLQQSAHKLEMYENGVRRMQDADLSLVEGQRFQYAQLRAAQNGGLFVDRSAVRYWLQETIRYPLTYLDFEWDTYAVPPYPGMRPFDVLCFQYSMHIEAKAQAPLRHHAFLGEGDCREAFIRQLLTDIPADGTILVYNMEGAEKLRLKQLAAQFPAYAAELSALCDRMVDLSLPFALGGGASCEDARDVFIEGADAGLFRSFLSGARHFLWLRRRKGAPRHGNIRRGRGKGTLAGRIAALLPDGYVCGGRPFARLAAACRFFG